MGFHLFWLTLIFFTFSRSAFSQYVWSRYFDSEDTDRAYGLTLGQNDDCMVIGGRHVSGDENSEYNANEIIWTDSSGNIRGEIILPSSRYSYPIDVITTQSGNYIFCGQNSSHGFFNTYIIEFDSLGQEVFYYPSNQAHPFFLFEQLLSCTNGDLLVSGGPLLNGFLFLFDETRDSVWARAYGDSVELEHMVEINDGFLAWGPRPVHREMFFWDYDSWIVKTNYDGDSITSQQIGLEGDDYFVEGINTEDGIILFGYSNSFADNQDIWIVKFGSNLDTIWTKTLGSEFDESLTSAELCNDGNVLLGCTREYAQNDRDIWLLRISLDGDSLWSQTYSGMHDAYCASACQARNGNYIVAGTVGRTSIWLFSTNETVDTSAPPIIPNQFRLFQNFPNPFNPTTTISFDLAQEMRVSLDVFNVAGQQVVQLIDENLSVGNHAVEFDGTEFSSGIYFYQLRAGDFVETKKMVLMK